MNVKNGEIILCKGIKLDKGYENVLSYSESNMVTLCRNNRIAVASSYTINYSILDPSINSIDVAIPYANCVYANYIAFRNPNYGNKWFFAFVNRVKFVSPNTTTIEYTIDVFSTWFSKMNIGEAFIEREHVDDDTFGKHTLPEGLNTGEFVINKTVDYRLNGIGVGSYIVIGLSNLVENFVTPTKSEYNGIYSGLTYYVFDDATMATTFIKALMETWGYDASTGIYTMFMVPRSLFNNMTITWSTGNIGGNSITYGIIPTSATSNTLTDNLTFSMNDNIDGYTPKNNKLFTGEFNYLYATNNCGSNMIYHYEDFLEHTPKFKVDGALTIGCSIRMDPLNYKVGDPDFLIENRAIKDYGLVCGKFPTCSWNCDSFTNWLTTNALNIVADVGSKALISAASFATGNVAVGALTGLDAISTAIGAGADREKFPNKCEGNTNSGDIMASSNNLGFYFYKMCMRKEYAIVCDQYLSRFGYKVNEVKTPNIYSRTQFNFIKVGGKDELITGDIPASDLEEINNIFRKGVTIFHNYSTFGNYTQTNNIVTTP